MTAKINYKILVKRLKKQLALVRRKEKIGRQKLRLAMAKARKTAKVYERKLNLHEKKTHKKVVAAEAGAYLRIAKVFKKKAKSVVQLAVGKKAKLGKRLGVKKAVQKNPKP